MKHPFLILSVALAGLLNCSCVDEQGELDAFNSLNKTAAVSQRHLKDEKSSIDRFFSERLSENHAKWLHSYEWFNELSASAYETIALIDEIQKDIIKDVDGGDADTLSADGFDNVVAPLTYKSKIGDNLYKAVNSYSELCRKTSDKAHLGHTNGFAVNPDADEWKESIFNLPAIGTMAMLSNLKCDILSSLVNIGMMISGTRESTDITKSNGEDSGGEEVFIVPTNTFVTRGGTYEARIVLAKPVLHQSQQIYVGGKKLEDDGMYSANCGSVGNKMYSGCVRYKNNDGVEKNIEFKGEYVVSELHTVITNDALFAGSPNKVSVSAAGVASENLIVTFTNATVLKKSSGEFVVIPNKSVSTCMVTVSARLDGRVQQLGTKTFDVVSSLTEKK